jgi:hypothetical protein
MPISKATPLELLDSIASTPPLGNLPNQLPRPDINCISEKVSAASCNIALSLLFDTKNCGMEDEVEHRAIVIDSCSLCGKVKDDVDGRLRVLKEVTLLITNCCVVCAEAIVAIKRHSKDSGSIERWPSLTESVGTNLLTLTSTPLTII